MWFRSANLCHYNTPRVTFSNALVSDHLENSEVMLKAECVFVQTLYKTQIRELKEEREEKNRVYSDLQQRLAQYQEERCLHTVPHHTALVQLLCRLSLVFIKFGPNLA